MAVGEGRVAGRGGGSPGYHVGVDRPEMGAERVEEALDVAARQGRRGLPGGAHEGGVADEDLVRPLAMADPGLVGLLAVPGPGAVRPVDLVDERVLPAGADLRDAHGAAGAAVEARAGSWPCPRSRSSRSTVSAERSVENVSTGPGRLVARPDERGQVGHHRRDVLAGHEGHQVEPVRADVADRPERAAAIGLEPPVPVAVEEQPVLEVAARSRGGPGRARRRRSARARAG